MWRPNEAGERGQKNIKGKRNKAAVLTEISMKSLKRSVTKKLYYFPLSGTSERHLISVVPSGEAQLRLKHMEL